MCLAAFQDNRKIERVAILGAGVAGLQVADELQNKAGLECTIFDKVADVGGVWRENYADFGLQVPKELYEFPGVPFECKDVFPTGPQVQAYIQDFARAKGLYPLCKFNTEVVKTEQTSKGAWKITHRSNGQEKTDNFDYFVVCTGMYSCPSIPQGIPGKFAGQQMHSGCFTDREAVKGKNVIVVGGGKSAIDCAVAAVNRGAEGCCIVFRQAHWPVPRYLLGLIPFKWATYSRFGHFFLQAHHDVSENQTKIHQAFELVKYVFWRVVELLFCFQFGLKGDLVPEEKVEIDLFGGGQILSYEFRELVKQGKIKPVKGAICEFNGDMVKVQQKNVEGSKQSLPADVVVYGTGFRKSYDYLPTDVKEQLMLEKDGNWLHRNILPTKVRNLAFVGAEVSTFNNILTQALQSLWLRKHLTEGLELPSQTEMETYLAQEMAWKRSWMPMTGSRASIYQLHMTKYHDMLLEDMQLSPYCKSNSLAEIFVPYEASDYAHLFAATTPAMKKHC